MSPERPDNGTVVEPGSPVLAPGHSYASVTDKIRRNSNSKVLQVSSSNNSKANMTVLPSCHGCMFRVPLPIRRAPAKPGR